MTEDLEKDVMKQLSQEAKKYPLLKREEEHAHIVKYQAPIKELHIELLSRIGREKGESKKKI